MLVLSRKIGEAIHCQLSAETIRQLAEGGGSVDIALRIIKINGNRIRLGIECPDEVKVIRHELLGQPCNGAPAAPEPTVPEDSTLASGQDLSDAEAPK